MKVLVVIIALVHFIQGAVIIPGKCPEIKSMNNFEAEKFTGTWYTVEAYPNNKYSEGVQCSHNKISYENKVFKGIYTGYQDKTNEEVKIPYESKFNGDGNVADFASTYNFNGEKVEVQSLILDTDYDNYAIYLSYCIDNATNCHKNVKIMGRNKSLSVEIRKKIHDFLTKHNLETSHLRKISRDMC